MRKTKLKALIILTILIGAGESRAQSGTIPGKVIDQAGSAVREVHVTASKGGVEKSTDTDSNGKFELAGLPDGAYNLTFEKNGYQGGEQEVEVRGGRAMRDVIKILKIDPRSAMVKGKVVDPNGQPVSGVAVSLKNRETGATHTASTRDDGEYSFQVVAGNYDVEISATGFAVYKAQDITVASSQVANADITLGIGGIASIVTVSGEPPVELTESSINTTISGRTITELPLLNRAFQDLAFLIPGVTR